MARVVTHRFVFGQGIFKWIWIDDGKVAGFNVSAKWACWTDGVYANYDVQKSFGDGAIKVRGVANGKDSYDPRDGDS